MREGRNIVMVLALPLISLLVLTGCTSTLPTQLETKLASNGNADDHMAAAILYQKQADEYEAKAEQFEQKAAQIRPLEDPKGFRRQALEVAAEENRNKAEQMEMLHASHFEKAQALYGKKSQE